MKQFFILLLTATTLLLGCDKSYEKFEPNPGYGFSDTTWPSIFLNSMPVNDLYQNLALEPLIDSVSAQNGGTINFPNNITVTVPANSFLLNGTPLTDGKATIRFLLITKKGEMVRMCLPTQSNGYLLESGGEIYIDALKNGKPLALATGKQIAINYRSTYQPNPLMRGFIGSAPTTITGANSCFDWIPVSDSGVRIVTTPNGYQIITSNLHWINCDYFNDTANVKTTVAVTMPVSFTNANTYTFIVFKNNNGIMQFDADAANRIWIKNKVPVNKSVIFISISKRGDDYYFGVSETYTTVNQHVVLKPEKKKIQDIVNYLSSL